MRSLVPAILLAAACGGGSGSSADITVTTHFDVTQSSNMNASPLGPLVGQSVDLEIVLDEVGSYTMDSADCKSTIVYQVGAARTASGPSAALVTSEILDKLPDWDVRFELCPSATSSITAESAINELNLAFACGGVPASALVAGANGYPEITSFTATSCNATILDVVNNRALGASDFSITFDTGPDRLP